MIREAGREDREAVLEFLKPHTARSMFLCSNIASQGIGWSQHPHATRIFLWMTRDGIGGVFGLTRGGFLLVQAPDVPLEAYTSFATAVTGERALGATGMTSQVSALLDALGLAKMQYAINHEEPLCELALQSLDDPKADLRPPTADHVDLLYDWLTGYTASTGLVADQKAIRGRAEAAVQSGTKARLLFEDGTPVAMATINAAANGHVQVGGVFVPPERRGKGLGRRVTQAILVEARGNWAHTGVLFSNNDAATKAYEAIGFRQVDTFRVAILAEPARLGTPA